MTISTPASQDAPQVMQSAGASAVTGEAPPRFRRLAVIGLGLIGGSLALAAKNAGMVASVSGCARHQASLDAGLAMGVIDAGFLSAADAVKGADLVFLSVPVAAMAAVMEDIAPHLEAGAIVTDGGSVKGSVWQAASRLLPEPANFVAGHPIAGREKSGVTAATHDLYVNHRVILTPVAQTSPQAIAAVTLLWQAVGAQVETLAIDEHDRILAETSHLPHLLAFSLVDTLSRQGDSHEIFHYAAGGFRDFTRVASSSPVMWRDIFTHNKAALTTALDAYEAGLKRFRRAMDDDDVDTMMGIMTRANDARDFFLSQVMPPATPPQHQEDDS